MRVKEIKRLRDALKEILSWLPEQKNAHETAIKCIAQNALKDDGVGK